VPDGAIVGVFEDAKRANRTVRWLRRSGLHPRVDRVGRAFEVTVPFGPEEQEAHRVLQALERTHERAELAKPTGWDWVRSRLFNLENVGIVVAVVGLAVLLLAIGIWLWTLVGMIGWLALIVVLAAALVYFHFSGIPHSAVKAPRRYSHKHDITMEDEQQVQYRLAWAREQYRKSRESRFLRRRPKK
jgi:hypothetical protein